MKITNKIKVISDAGDELSVSVTYCKKLARDLAALVVLYHDDARYLIDGTSVIKLNRKK